jgi:hypothetical protein
MTGSGKAVWSSRIAVQWISMIVQKPWSLQLMVVKTVVQLV